MGLNSSDINQDISIVMDLLQSGGTEVPSRRSLIKYSFMIPIASILFSVLSVGVCYMGTYGFEGRNGGVVKYFLTDGWAVVLPTILTGIFFSLMAYNNLIMYFSLPNKVREGSVIISHLRSVVSKATVVFVFSLAFLCAISWFSPWGAVSIPVLQFLFIFIINFVVGSEINRLGVGFGMNKIVGLIKKI